MLRALLAGAELSMIRDYVSPAFFEVMPPRRLTSEARALGRARFRSSDAALRSLSSSLPPELSLGEAGGLRLDEDGRSRHGQRVLQLYFHQIYTQPTAFLDLRPERFAATATQTTWSPGWLRITWEPDFIDAIQRLYRGFYADDEAMFSSALSDLSLEAAQDTFIRHFGDGDQRSVRFEQAHFHQTFHQAFQACAQQAGRLHQNFISLGLMLGCLYAHLEPLDMALDVRAAHDDALATAAKWAAR
jgi:hypothetical protein